MFAMARKAQGKSKLREGDINLCVSSLPTAAQSRVNFRHIGGRGDQTGGAVPSFRFFENENPDIAAGERILGFACITAE